MRSIFIVLLLMISAAASAQELYIFTEPASNMPAHSLSAKYTGRFQKGIHSQSLDQRHTGEIMLGASKNWMIHAATTFSDMYSSTLSWESVRAYAKYRFLSSDEVYKHFRMAAFGEVAFSKFDRIYDEISLDGDVSGFQTGVIATQLLHKLALSSTVSYSRTLNESVYDPYQLSVFPKHAINYSLSAGYLLFPKEYTDYKQTNLNLYAEFLGQRTIDKNLFNLDFAPGIQFIFNSQAKLNLGYRMQLNTNMHRMTKNSGLISFEWLFLNVLK